ncbi:NHRF3 protein, partial [Amia calva]|nr:NHRF3 protein [Amia calva]
MASFQPTVIKLSKQEGQSYGFFLRVEMGTEGHLIRCIEKGGLAELAGLKDGDRVLRVNGVFVDDQEHARVVQLVKESGQSVTFHMLDEATYEKAKKSGINLSGADESRPAQPPLMNGVAGSALKPKLCYLVNVKEGFGFSLKSTKGYQGMFFTDVKPSGAAAKAGVRNNDRLIEINGENVEKSTHDQIVAKVKASGKSVTFLVVDEETNTHFRNKNLKLGASLATVKHLPHKPRIAEMTRGPEGYGYYLRAEKKRPGHFIKDIDAGSPAEKAGLKDMDRLVAVNGEAVDSLVHDKVVEKIRECGNKCTLLIVDEETDNIYRMAGASPLLFWEEMKDCFDSAPEKVRPTHQQEAQQSSAVPVQLPSPTPPPPSEEQKDYKPKLCKLRKTTGGFGFHLNAIQGIQGQFVKEVLTGVTFPQCPDMSFKVTAYADDIAVLVVGDGDVEQLEACQRKYERLSSAKINWAKSNAVLVGDWNGCATPYLPAGLRWDRGGFQYFGVFLGDDTTTQKNWEGLVEKFKARLQRWWWLLPQLSYRGRALVVNNLVASSVWHRFIVLEPPEVLIKQLQSILLDFFWDGLHWIRQCVLYLPLAEGGQGLIDIASRTAAFRLKALQRLLYSSEDLPWAQLALGFLRQVQHTEVPGHLLKVENVTEFSLFTVDGKQVYKACVKVRHQQQLQQLPDTHWREQLGVGEEFEPAWRTLYKPPLQKRSGDLQWRILHSIIAINSFLTIIKPGVTDNCPFCSQRETVFHCFFFCARLRPLFMLMKTLIEGLGLPFTEASFIFGFKYQKSRRSIFQLSNFIFGQAKFAILKSRKNKVNGFIAQDPVHIFKHLVVSKIRVDFQFYSAMQDLDSFELLWCVNKVLCEVEGGVLVLFI